MDKQREAEGVTKLTRRVEGRGDCDIASLFPDGLYLYDCDALSSLCSRLPSPRKVVFSKIQKKP